MCAAGSEPESADGVGFTANRVAALGTIDAVIIGSGIGSLTVAALLSRAGWRVLVLEQHGVAGGAMHTFTMKNAHGAWEYDAGVNCALAAAAAPVVSMIIPCYSAQQATR